MNKCFKLSIIIPNYNHAQFLEQRLDSVFNQTFQNFEVILLDDCSTDNSIEIINKYKQHPKVSHVVINNKNSGSTFLQWQKGISLAKGELIWIAESDDYCELNFLEKLLNHTSECDIVYSQSYDVNEEGQIIYDRINYTSQFEPNIWVSNFKMTGESFVNTYLLHKNVIPNASAVIFSNKLLSPNIFSNDLLGMKTCGDWLFWIKIIYNAKIGFVDEYLNYFRNHENITRNHNLVEDKKRRLAEESLIRNYLYKSLKIKDNKTDFNFLEKWFNLFKYSDVFTGEFRSIKMIYISYVKFYFYYFKFKFFK